MKHASPLRSSVPAALGLTLAIFASSAHAASGTWNVDADSSWTTTSNWVDNIMADGAGFTANLTYDFTAARAISLPGVRTIGILNMGDTNGTHAVTLQGTSTQNFTLSNGSDNSQINQVSTGKGATITGLNLIVGGNGTLVVSNASSGGSLVINSGIQGSGTVAQTVEFNTAGTIDFDANRTISNGGASSLAVVKSGAGTLQLRGAGTYTGGFTLNAGTLEFGFNQTALGTGTFTINGGVITNGYGSARTLSTNNAQVWAGNFAFGTTSLFGSNLSLGTGAVTLTGNRTVTVNSSSTSRTFTVGGSISGEGYSLTKAGNAILALGGANNYTGGTIVSAGTLATLSTGGDFGFGNVSLTGTTSKLTLGNASSIADTATLSFISTMATGSINLNFDGTEFLAGITKTNGTPSSIVSGLYTADQLNTFFGTTIFTGAGALQFGAVPEPSSYAAILGALALASVAANRRR
jgi:autotransporter-associated beta strand protein